MSILKNRKSLILSVSASLALLLSACGGASSSGTAPSGATSPSSAGSVPASGSGSSSPGSSNSGYTSIPFAFALTGSSGGTPNGNPSAALPACTNTSSTYYPACQASGFATDNHLVVYPTAQSSGWIVDQQNSGYTVAFNCVQFNITVRPQGATSGGRTASVLVSTTGAPGTGSCAGATPNPSLDFSDQANYGHGSLEVDVQPMMYDNCHNSLNSNGDGYDVTVAGCALNNVYYTHVIRGSISVQIDSN